MQELPPAPHVVSRVPEWHVPPWQHPFRQDDGEHPPPSEPRPPDPLDEPLDELPDELPDDDPPDELPEPEACEHVPPVWQVPPTAVQS